MVFVLDESFDAQTECIVVSVVVISCRVVVEEVFVFGTTVKRTLWVFEVGFDVAGCLLFNASDAK